MALLNLPQELIYSFKDGVATLRVNHPDWLHAITQAMFDDMR